MTNGGRSMPSSGRACRTRAYRDADNKLGGFFLSDVHMTLGQSGWRRLNVAVCLSGRDDGGHADIRQFVDSLSEL